MNLLLSAISHPLRPLLHANDIRNIIFDFGNVICNIDVQRTEQAFSQLGWKPAEPGSTESSPAYLFDQFDLGKVTPAQFREQVRAFIAPEVTDRQIDDAWNALLLDVPEQRIALLEKLRHTYRLFLLSNSNQIHYDLYTPGLFSRYNYSSWNDLFEHAWFSFQIGLKKPHREVFDYVVDQPGLDRGQTLFIDDTLMHVEGANKAGIHAHHLDLSRGQDICQLFE